MFKTYNVYNLTRKHIFKYANTIVVVGHYLNNIDSHHCLK